tara:strand:+ start:10137 stop:11144 length:1008 start_codon:yes stop_codon:yes gene_type:complete
MKIFICQTPFQLYYTNRLVHFFNEESPKALNFIIIHSGLYISNEEWMPNVSFLNFNSSSSKLENLIQLKKIKKLVDKLIGKKDNQELDFYVPHIGGLLANYLYFSKHFQKKTKISFNLYYEGVLYFYDFQEKLQFFHFTRYIISLFLGYRYRYCKTILPYNSDKVKHIYTPLKEYTKGPKEKVKEIPFLPLEKYIIENKNIYLILGGPVDYINEFYKKSLEEILQKSISPPKIYYKGHASFHTHNEHFKEVFYAIAKEFGVEYIEITEQLPIEKLIDDVNPSEIYSYYSSALINLKLISGNRCDIKCYISEGPKLAGELEKIFQHFQIRLNLIKH